MNAPLWLTIKLKVSLSQVPKRGDVSMPTLSRRILFLLLVIALVPFAPTLAQNHCISDGNYASTIQAFMDSQQIDEAINAATCAIQSDPKAPLPYMMRGVAYYMEGDYNNALTDLNVAD